MNWQEEFRKWVEQQRIEQRKAARTPLPRVFIFDTHVAMTPPK